ncbi:hypothetical protein CR513_39030, partial [Mucuna pruriens]
MALSRRPYAYSKVDKEDPEEILHRRAQFLIHKVLEKANSRRKPSCLRIRISKLKVKIGKRLRRLRKRIMSGVSAAKLGIQGHVMSPLKTWKRFFGRGRQSLITLPPLILDSVVAEVDETAIFVVLNYGSLLHSLAILISLYGTCMNLITTSRSLNSQTEPYPVSAPIGLARTQPG